MKSTNIKGKEYVEVNQRIKYLRANFKGYQLLSELVKLEAGVCIFKATLINESGVKVANGFAYEKEGSTFINKTSYIENCETSAWGRCLGNFGIGIDTSVASADEVKNAIKQQNTPAQDVTEIKQKESEVSPFRKQVLHLAKSKDERLLVPKLLKLLKVNDLKEVKDKKAFLDTLESEINKLKLENAKSENGEMPEPDDSHSFNDHDKSYTR